MTTREKIQSFVTRTHLLYLLLAISLYLLKGVLYFSIKEIPVEIHHIHMRIDEFIPFIKYFYVFYVSYYVLPEILLWILSFYDKKKFWSLFWGVAAANVVCCICFVIYQVQMIRPEGYPMDLALRDVKSVSDFFDFCVSMQYKADAGALNCFPSLHATMGCLVVLLGLKTTRDEARFPLWLRCVSVFIGLGIIASTVFVKQHYFIDLVAGVILMVIMYYCARKVVTAAGKRKKNELLEKNADI